MQSAVSGGAKPVADTGANKRQAGTVTAPREGPPDDHAGHSDHQASDGDEQLRAATPSPVIGL